MLGRAMSSGLLRRWLAMVDGCVHDSLIDHVDRWHDMMQLLVLLMMLLMLMLPMMLLLSSKMSTSCIVGDDMQ